MNSLLEKLVREVIKMPLGLKFALCVSMNIVLFSIAGPLAGLQKENTSSVVGFIVVALYNTSTTCPYCCSKEDFKVVDKHLARNLSSRTIYFPVASNHVKALGLR